MRSRRIFLFVAFLALLGFGGCFLGSIFIGYMFDESVVVFVCLSKLCLFSSFVSFLFYNFTKSHSHFKKSLLCFLGLLFVGAFFSVAECYRNFDSFSQSTNSSLLIEKYEASPETKKFLPFYDDFYKNSPNKAEYAVSMSKNDLCTEITASNNYGLTLYSPDYASSFTKCSSIDLLIRTRLDLYKAIFDDNFVLHNHQTASNDNVDYSFYVNNNGYLVVIKDGTNVYVASLLYAAGFGINEDEFINQAIKHYLLCCEAANEQYLPDPDHTYSQENTGDGTLS